MARRKKRNKPNLPDSVLERARRNAGVEDEPEQPTADVSDADDSADSSADNAEVDTASISARATRRRNLSSAQLERTRQRGELTNEIMQEALVNPTKIVTEEELSQDYGHVIADLRNMAVLAAILVAGLITIGFVFPVF
ncbi:MAG: hypothetical protein AAFV98_17190 [Chloroflexota bacterium]